MNKIAFKVMGAHALMVGGVAAAITVVADLLRFSQIVLTETTDEENS